MTWQKKIERWEKEICEELGLALERHNTILEPGENPVVLTPQAIAGTIDHTLLKATATQAQVESLCLEAKENGFASVCVNPVNVKLAASLLAGSSVKVCTVTGFPLGANTSMVKAAEAKEAVDNGAEEVDMVINIGALKAADYNRVFQDILRVVEAVRAKALVKVIIETCYLSEEEKIKACLIAKRAGADFVKTSTGFGTGGATPEDIALMRQVVGQELGVKASGGIRDFNTAKLMIESGANRLGTSSGREIIKG